MNTSAPVRLEQPKLTIPRVYNVARDGRLCAQDIIAYVRSEVAPDPWTPVIIVTKDTPIAVEELEGVRIYWSGVNDDKAQLSYSLSVNTCAVVKAQELDISREDCGINAIADKFRDEYCLQTFNILVLGDSNDTEQTEVINKLRNYAMETCRSDIMFPYYIIRMQRLLPSGLDLSVAANKIDRLRERNDLDAHNLKLIMEELESQIDPTSTTLQNLDDKRSNTMRLLNVYLTLKYNLPPMYVSAFIAEYIQFRCLYAYDKLSLYERLTFLKELPDIIGWIGHGQQFNFMAKVHQRIYPYPHCIIDLDKRQPVKDLKFIDFADPNLKVMDYRTFFPQSSVPLDPDMKAGMVAVSESDEAADKKLAKLFVECAQMVPNIRGITIKNSVMVMKDGVRYLVYCPEYCGIRVIPVTQFMSPTYFDINERDFGNIIDAQIEMALLQPGRVPSASEGAIALANKWRGFQPKLALRRPIPLDVWFYGELLPYAHNGLSYYDKQLRCNKDVLAIATEEENGTSDVPPIFRYFVESSLRTGEGPCFAVNSFGTIANYRERDAKLTVTYEAFGQEGLL